MLLVIANIISNADDEPSISSEEPSVEKTDPVHDFNTQSSALESSDSENVPLIKLKSSAVNDRASPSTSVSSTRSVPPLIIKRKIPRPPALPKRKPSLSSITSLISATSLESKPENLKPPEISKPKSPVPEVSKRNEAPEICSSIEASCSNFDAPSTVTKEPEPPLPEKRFVRPHGFERGLRVERIHAFLKRGDTIFAVVQFKNCDIIEILATRIVQHYEPLNEHSPKIVELNLELFLQMDLELMDEQIIIVKLLI
ncbi:unnamed protein product [Strongylus vulgaris]|uniref:Uncharacterized protein n=1 Tax=Strongylus vulgaris TaxID=40348 RepID=A0A3P7INL7_STRVU|nr:unnamed protein product [Strongylus vulgaris]